MAWYNVTYSCGHDGRVQLFGKVKDREHKLEWYQNTAVCPECYKAQQEKSTNDYMAKFSPVDLEGSEKQIKWAKDLRVAYNLELDNATKYVDGQNQTARTNDNEDLIRKCEILKNVLSEIRNVLNNEKNSGTIIDALKDCWLETLNPLESFARFRREIDGHKESQNALWKQFSQILGNARELAKGD